MGASPRAICYDGAPDRVIGWICGSDACLTTYLIAIEGEGAKEAAACCAHLPPVEKAASGATTTLEAPAGTIGAIGGDFPEEAADSGDEA